MSKEEEFTISVWNKNGKFPAGVYKLKKPNTWYPILYFRKPKSAKKSDFDRAVDYIERQ